MSRARSLLAVLAIVCAAPASAQFYGDADVGIGRASAMAGSGLIDPGLCSRWSLANGTETARGCAVASGFDLQNGSGTSLFQFTSGQILGATSPLTLKATSGGTGITLSSAGNLSVASLDFGAAGTCCTSASNVGITFNASTGVTFQNAAAQAGGYYKMQSNAAASGATVAFIVDTPGAWGAGDKLQVWRMGTADKASVDFSGYIASATPNTLFSVYVNALLATGTNYGGHKSTKPFKVTDLSLYVSVASSATAANEVFTVTDGTNTCTATLPCDTVTNTTGAKSVATANGAGTGCVYAANATLSISLTTQGCGTAATIKNAEVVGVRN